VKKILGFFILKENNPGFNRLFKRLIFLAAGFILVIFNNAETARKHDSREIQTIVAVGDIMLSGSAKPFLRRKGYGYSFGDPVLSKLVMNADLAFANLECPVTKTRAACKDKKFVFRADPASIKAIRKAGFDMLSLANNHIMDYKEPGLSSTINYCLKSGMVYSGAGADITRARKAAILKRNGITYGLLSYSMTYPKEFWATSDSAGAAYGEENTVIEDIQKAKKEADVVIVSFHWGAELADVPKAYQVKMAHTAIDSGADMVLGHHPHVPQPIEIYKGKPVFYSLGNYAFGSYSKKTPISFAARIILDKDRVSGIRIYPVIVDNYEVMFKPACAKNKRAEEIISYLDEISRPFGTEIIYDNGIGVVDLKSSR
jgi:poly-gamma-glutamate capsule biosynthesis protein CapA/YwtB (metallophosphatase superfamily)